MTSNLVKGHILSGLFGFSLGFLTLWLTSRWRQQKEKKRKSNPSTTVTEQVESLHWNPLDERRGLGDLITKVNHIGITVSDVGKSLHFYVDILGLQQIRRPNFDRHGAWLTMGNVELHLIKGIPAIPVVDNLQVAHIAFETKNIDEVLFKLRQLNIDVRQNLSITNAQKAALKDSDSKSKPIITQYFFTDPDGYFWELCNCEILTEFALNKNQKIKEVEYREDIPSGVVFDVARVAKRWTGGSKKGLAEQFYDILKDIPRATEVDEAKFNNLIKRRTIYGDIMQGFTDEDIREALLITNNSVPLAVRILTQIRGENKFYQPPAFLENGELTTPKSFFIDKNKLK
ncbi:unnamed protein product [Rotaria sordida]|uniref:VOC domain-containing protein n=1 Tax=Rotaria sordida TaxID=392033 RepID=A0A814P321_9BILA|nr:unnamed protein product [Rotaria sordida]CAF1137182.1 unnamed protein product [Rotaria sordida]CAF1152183.1 unnamed protein product [Rotaria sordida]CAF1220218.1 unnamed protein product [Rotaria sordida]CAF1303729.1 unnamed protein product [Rotaria sordida]